MNEKTNEYVKSPYGTENFAKSAQDRSELFGRDASIKSRQGDVDPVWRDVIRVRRHKHRQRVEEDSRHLGTRVVEHSTEDLRQLPHLRLTVTRSAATSSNYYQLSI